MRRVFIAALLFACFVPAGTRAGQKCEPLDPCTAKERALFERFRGYASDSIYSDRWRLIQLQDEMLVAFDTKSVVRVGDNAFRVWLRAEKPEWTQRWRDRQGNHAERANALVMQQDFDCSNRQARGVAMVAYLDRKVVWGPVDLDEEWHGIAPDTSEEYWYPQICKIITGVLPK